jgi:hypothetical protein
LSNAKLFRCPGEALLFGDGLKVKQVTQFHFGSVIASKYYSKKKAIFPRIADRL